MSKGTTGFEVASGPIPPAFWAATEKVYCVPTVKPEIVADVEATPSRIPPSMLAETV